MSAHSFVAVAVLLGTGIVVGSILLIRGIADAYRMDSCFEDAVPLIFAGVADALAAYLFVVWFAGEWTNAAWK